ncbi:unnamed protein product [Rhizoctonia solani]|uniref:NACHT domain-containing protein n=1 Tax=Rhizoctonia solani TaxID=456999 RepID=A0A8H2X1E1_9AGAM|nr:unnamed protein product [Rhizoctonia solani]
MPFREGIKQKYKETKRDLKAFFKSKDGSDQGTTRPNTPVGTPPPTSSPEVVGRVGSPGASVSGAPPLAQAPASLPVVSPPEDPDNHLNQPPQSTNLTEEHHPGMTGPSPGTPESGSQAVSTTIVVPTETTTSQPQVLERAIADTPSTHTGLNTSISAGKPESGQRPREPLGETSTGKGLKIRATGIVESAADALKIGLFQDIFGILQGFADMYMLEGTVKKGYDALRQWLEALLKVLDENTNAVTSPALTLKIQEARDFIEKELNSIGNKQSGKRHGRFLIANEEEERFLDCYRRIQEHVVCLSLNTSLLTSASINKIEEEQTRNHLSTILRIDKIEEEQSKNHLSTTLRISKIEEEQSKDHISSQFSRLPFSSSACYNSKEGEELKRRECTPGTRVNVLANIIIWADSANNGGGVYWINGMAGTGKTTIAYSLCKALDIGPNPKLAASFFCSRMREECRNVNMIIPSIAYQLALFSSSFRSALSAALDKDPEVHTKRLNLQFKALIEEPLVEAQPSFPKASVVVIDALDECDNKEATRDVLNLLLSKAGDLPIKFIVSSRPEPQIRDQMSEERVKSRLVLHELETGNVQIDIETYLRAELKPMEPAPGEAQIAALVKRAGILFIYAATAVRYIGYDNFQSDPEDRLRDILDGPQSQEDGQHEEIDQLYTTILEASLNDRHRRKDERDNMRQILYAVICAREPLTVAGISGLLDINSVKKVQNALRPLWSVLHVTGAGELAVVTTLHASFPDFMFSSTRSKGYHCDQGTHNQQLAERCFRYIAKTQARFNICGLESSYLLDENVPDIRKRVTSAIPLELLYACRYWADHVEAGQCSSALFESLQDFLVTRLLLWMEVMNLNKQMKAGIECMKMMVKWCDQFKAHQGLVELAQDAERFVEAFTSNPISRSTPHIYVSMLAFRPESAPIAKHYANYTHGPVKPDGTALARRQLAHLATWAFEKGIKAMAMSPDRLNVVLGMESDVVVVDSSSGRVVFGPFTYPGAIVKSVAFSPDSTRLFVGYTDDNDATILGWDIHSSTNDTMFGPIQLKGHTGNINCLSFSFDCARIATGSTDETVRVWHAENGNQLHCLETQDTVYDVKFSPDSTQIAAGFEKALQIWDSETGHTILGPLTTPIPADRVSFSPDKSRIVYASVESDYKSIYVLDTQTGEQILGPIEGHTDRIGCIGCSPDGRYIVSGSYDPTVCLWDAQNGNLVLGPLEAHTGGINSVAFSPDGSRIISACSGGLVCTWDARQRNLTSGSSNAPFDRITCVKFSCDGTRFVSGSGVGTICTWDAHTGEMKVGPIKAHTRQINAVDFLNDHVVSGSIDGKIWVCDAVTGEAALGPLEVHPGRQVEAIAYSPDGKHIATGSGDEIRLWDAQTGSRVLSPLTGLQGTVASIQFSPDSTRIVGGSRGYSNNIVVRSVSYSPDGTLIASGSDDGTIIIRDASTGKQALGPLTGHSNYVLSVHFSPDSTRLVSGSLDRTIRIWDVQTGGTLFEILNGHENYITSVAYSPDGTRILSRSNDMSVHIHDARSPEERALSGSESEVGEWTLNKDGWVVDDQSRLLVWVPWELHKALGQARTLVIIPHGDVHLKFDKSRLGESWAKSYASRF